MISELTNRDVSTILAALRLYQSHLRGVVTIVISHPSEAGWISEIATDGGRHDPMSGDEIDDLCDRVNETD